MNKQTNRFTGSISPSGYTGQKPAQTELQKQTNPPVIFYLFMGFTIGLFVYFAGCAFANVQPFTHKTTTSQENSNCEGLQLKGYCCKSQAQFENGDCTK